MASGGAWLGVGPRAARVAAGCALLVVHGALAVVATKLLTENPALLVAIGAGLQAFFGARANYLLSRAYQQRGYLYQGLVPATSPADAIAKFKAVGQNIPAEWRLEIGRAHV